MKNVIIIGSGLGGLIAGNLIAKKGHKVTLFEAHRTFKVAKSYVSSDNAHCG